MTIWKPPPAVCVKVIGLAWHGARLLAAEVEGSDGSVKGIRPLGGSIDFGETREQALHREFMEELGCCVTICGEWHVFENLYQHEGATGHEYVFAADVTLSDRSLYDREEITVNDTVPALARWFDLREVTTRGLELYPAGLQGLLQSLGR